MIPEVRAIGNPIARTRSGVNVMSDMLVAILLDAGHVAPATEATAITASPNATSSREPQAS